MNKTSYWTEEKEIAEYESIARIYKHKDNLGYMLNSQNILNLAYCCAIEYIDKNLGKTIKRTNAINVFPVVQTDDNLVLVLVYLDGQLVHGNKGKVEREEISLENVLFDFYQMFDGMKMPPKILLLNLYTNQIAKNVLTPFGSMYLAEPTYIPVDELIKKQD